MTDPVFYLLYVFSLQDTIPIWPTHPNKDMHPIPLPRGIPQHPIPQELPHPQGTTLQHNQANPLSLANNPNGDELCTL